MSERRRIHEILAVAVLPLLLAACATNQPAVDRIPAVPMPPPEVEKIAITSLDQLPQHSYEVAGTVSELFADPSAFTRFAADVRRDLESDLSRFEITDVATLKGWYTSLANLAILDHRWNDVLAFAGKSRDLEEKEAAKLTSGRTGEALIAAFETSGADQGTPDFKQVFRDELARRVNTWPWDVVQDVVERRKGQSEYMSVNLILGVIAANYDPVVAQSGALGSDLARGLVSLKVAELYFLPLKDELLGVYTDYIATNAEEKTNIWPERDMALPATGSYSPVMIGIWDSGVDVAVYGDQVFSNPGERRDGRDTDGNGFVDDRHGIAFDVDGVYSTTLLHPEEEQAGRVDELRHIAAGLTDLQSNVDSPAAAEVREYMSNLAPDEMQAFQTGLSFFGLHAHGTHVAGITLAGNPYASVLTARISFDYHSTPKAMTHEVAHNHADSYRRTAKYFTQHGVRVVNMSWGWTFKEIESSLEANGVGEDAAERATLAREMLSILTDGLHEAMASTPQVLYCTAAGNSDSDVEFDVSIPANFLDLSNMIVVGAVDQAGDPTDFTSSGENVVVYANGFEVESFVPGGHRMPMSGTSMASPQVCNLAAKLVAVKDVLQPADLIRIIEEGADPHPNYPEMRLLNPKATLAKVMDH